MDKENPLISVITLLPGREKTLNSTLESIMKQQTTFELIIIAPVNFDIDINQLLDVVSKFDNVVLVRDPDVSPSEGLNNGLKVARGNWIYCLNSGDVVLQDAFEELKKHSIEKPNTSVFVGNGILFDKNLKIVGGIFSSSFHPISIKTGNAAFVHQSTFIKREVLLSVGGFSPKILTSYDLDILVRIGLTGAEISKVNNIWGGWRIEEDSISLSSKYQKIRATELSSIKELIPLSKHLTYFGFFISIFRILRHPLRPILRRGIGIRFWLEFKGLRRCLK